MDTPKRRGRPPGDPAKRVARYTVLLNRQQHERVLRYGQTVSAGVNRILRVIFEGQKL